MKGRLRIGIPIILLTALLLYGAYPHPTRDQSELKAIAAESQRLITAYPIARSGQPVDIPKDKWPPAIAGLKPFSVTVFRGTVEITTTSGFDGWGYGFAPDKRNLTMLVKCWSELGQGLYWHGSC